ncbi:unnamed protein product [Pseudo-nitzschia multistriata]|uniref:Uncharacterized protein n=1 Tax=Pseudo-nitzschia multistriata TaxID=183589 RepID=A0A448Z6L0_9STRA|nr:unnamed protein product [Pseudo-nitzschia multistriata]
MVRCNHITIVVIVEAAIREVMKSFYQIILLLINLPGQLLLSSHAQIYPSVEDELLFQVGAVASSSFELSLYPTPTKLDNRATAQIQNKVENVLLSSSSSSSDFDSLKGIKISVERVQFIEGYKLQERSTAESNKKVSFINASIFQFKAITYFDVNHEPYSNPSQFTVDNLIVRTFSQPSTKSSFIELVGLTGDPFLVDVEGIGIDVKSNERVPTKDKSTQLSRVDIILITSSCFILIGVVLVLFAHSKKEGYEDLQEQKYFKTKNRSKVTTDNASQVDGTDENDPIKAQEGQISLSRMMSVEKNIIEAGSLESSIDSQSQIAISLTNKSPEVSVASPSPSHFTSGQSSSDMSSLDTSSSDSSSSDSSSCSPSSSAFTYRMDESICESIREQSDSTLDSEPMGSEEINHYSKVHTAATSELALKLLNLTNTATYVSRKKFGSGYSSSVSAPTILEEAAGQYMNESKVDEKSIKSAQSAGSIESVESDTTLNASNPIFKGLVMFGSTQEFHNSWMESRKKALEDIEEESIDDVFHVDVQRSVIFNGETEAAKSTWSPSVSEWMKSIRVFNSASEMQSSAFSNGKENDSLDLSLESSLATSIVEP